MASVLAAAGAGAVGGFVASFLPEGRKVKAKVNGAPTQGGWVVGSLLGAIAAVGALLGTETYADVVLFGEGSNAPGPRFTAPDLVASLGVGFVSLKWLVNHQASNAWRAVAVAANASDPRPALAPVIASGKARDALKVLRR